MQKYKLTRIMRYTEVLEVEAVDWEEANKLIFSDELEFERNHDDDLYDSQIKYIGESEIKKPQLMPGL